MMKYFIIAVVPAKMTSRRLPGKNLIDLCGQPLIYYSIRAARLVRQVSSVYVSSEDTRVLDTAARLGAETIVRPPALSDHNVSNQQVLKHAVESVQSLSGAIPDLVVLLQPTHPLRMPADIERGIEMILDDPKADSLFSLIPADDLRGQIIDGRFMPEVPLPRNKLKEPRIFKNCGSFYIFRPERTFMTDRFFGEQIIPMVLERPEFEVDIDTASDLRLADCLLRSRIEEFGHFSLNI